MKRVGDEGEVLLSSFPLKFPLLVFFHLTAVNTFMPSVAVQLPSHNRLFSTPWTVARQTSLSFVISWSLLKLISI